MNHKKKKESPFITSINPCEEKRKPFLLADTETLFDERKNQNMDDTLTIQSENEHSQESDTIQTEMVHQPYAAGVMMVIPGIDLSENRLYTFFSEEYSKEIFPSFAERSKKILVRFRDSYHLLTGKLDYLAKNLCPELGSKGSIPYNEVNIDNLGNMKESSDSSIKYVTFSKEGKSFYTNKSVCASPTSESIAPESRDAYSIPKT
ncbi:unnamed protein product [Amaranthus hypochondriacus]